MNNASTNNFTRTYYTSQEQWSEQRKNGLGGSDAACVLHLNKYKTPYTLWLEKIGELEPDDLSDNEKVFWGNVHEPVLAEQFSMRHPELKVRRDNAVLRSTRYPFMFANVDRVITDEEGNKGILEIKTASTYLSQDWKEGVPDYYYPQLLHYMIVTGYTYGYFVVLIGGNEYKEYRIDYDEEDAQLLISAECKFWNENVADRIAPQADAGAMGSIFKRYQDAGEELTEVTDPEKLKELEEMITKHKELKGTIDELEKLKKDIEAKLKEEIGDSKGIIVAGNKVSWIRSEYAKFNQKDFKEAYPDIYEQYCEKSKRDGGLRFSTQKGK